MATKGTTLILNGNPRGSFTIARSCFTGSLALFGQWVVQPRTIHAEMHNAIYKAEKVVGPGLLHVSRLQMLSLLAPSSLYVLARLAASLNRGQQHGAAGAELFLALHALEQTTHAQQG